MTNRTKQKSVNPLEGLLSHKPELEQFSTSIPNNLYEDFMKILKREEIKMTPAVCAVVKLFNDKYRDPSARKEFKANTIKSPEAGDAFKALFNTRYEDESGIIYGRIPSSDYVEFHEIRKSMKLKVFEGAIVGVSLFLSLYKNMKKKSAKGA